VDCHIGSQLTELAPFLEAVDKLLVLIDGLAEDGIHIRHLDVGGGLGVRYDQEAPPEPSRYAEQLKARLQDRNLTLVFEPGRAIAANAGVLLTRVEHLKPPSQEFRHRRRRHERPDPPGPVQRLAGHYTGGFHLAAGAAGLRRGGTGVRDRRLYRQGPYLAITEGDLLAVRSAGAYGFVMASNYNSRPRAAEVMVDGDQAFVVREREQLTELWRGESLLPGA
jgi:diaminopimelate decarboxylase